MIFFFLLGFSKGEEDNSNATISITNTVTEDLESSVDLDDDFEDYDEDYPHRGNRERIRVNCTAPNTRRSYGNKCRCKEGFFGDDPATERGCWKCEPKCHSQAVCHYPGRCKCAESFVGDGINQCSPPIPNLQTVSRGKVGGVDVILVNYDGVGAFIPFQAFAKVTNQISPCFITGPQQVGCTCYSPSNELSLSFDGFNYSNAINIPESIADLCKKTHKSPRIKQQHAIKSSSVTKETPKDNVTVETLIVILCFVGILYLLQPNRQCKRSKQTSDEAKPLITAAYFDREPAHIINDSKRRRMP